MKDIHIHRSIYHDSSTKGYRRQLKRHDGRGDIRIKTREGYLIQIGRIRKQNPRRSPRMDKNMEFREHNNRKIADKHAEYITGQTLRRFIADTVRRHAGDDPHIFDGAAGSGQLEQYLNPRRFEAVEIQAAACEALKNNYPQAQIHHTSYFLHPPAENADCAIMNPPFSLKYKDLTDEEKQAVRTLFPWKKSGVLDDIFILKSLLHSKKWSIQVAFPGIAYRRTESRMRQEIGNRLTELWTIQNAFEDTAIDVLLIVIDKDKTEPHYRAAVYDCKDQTVRADTVETLDSDYNWPLPREPDPPPEAIDIDTVNQEVVRQDLAKIRAILEWHLFLVRTFGANIDYTEILDTVRRLCDEYRKNYGEPT